MDKTHSLLARQLKHHFPDANALPENLQQFIEAVNAAYWQSDDDRRMVERSLELRSQELIATNSQLRAALDSTSNGILVVDRDGKISSYNQKFVELWQIPPVALAAQNDTKALNFVLDQLKEPEAFLKKVLELYSQPEAESFDILEFKDGRVFERSSKPQLVNGESVGRVWSFSDITAHKQAEEQIKATLREKEVLLKEIHHRVKNNMQVISSLLSLQAGYIQNQEVLRLFKESEGRIRSMALIHEKLYQTENLGQVDFSEYIPSLTNHLMSAYASATTAVALRLNIEPIALGLDAAIPCGLIINELVSNALKHAFGQRERGDITIEFHRKNIPPQGAAEVLILRVKDNGVGFPEKFDFRQSTSLGLQLVLSLVKQLNGKIRHYYRNGTQFQITFQKTETIKRRMHP